jgi:hypothetical protein
MSDLSDLILGDEGLIRWPHDHLPTRAPRIDGFEPGVAGQGDVITVRGAQLNGASVFVGDRPARTRRSSGRSTLVFLVPRIEPGDHELRLVNEFGSTVAPEPLAVVEASNRITYRGDTDGWHVADGNSIVPSALQQPVLALVCEAPDSGLPAGHTSATIRQLVEQKLDAATDSVNAFWQEATYGKTSFDVTVHNQILTLPNNLAYYFQNSRVRRVDGSGAFATVTWLGGETLNLLGDDGVVTVTFVVGTQAIAQVVTTINQGILNASADPTKPAMRALDNGGQVSLESTERSASAVLDITGGTARTTLGLDPTHVAITPGLDGVANRTDFMHHALDLFLAGKNEAQARQTMDGYACVIAVLAHDTTTNLLRAYADSVMTYDYPSGGKQAHFSDIVITTGYPWTTFAHEMGHCLGLPDLYDESGKQAGIEPAYLDIMGPYHYNVEAHPLAWAKHWRSRQKAGGGGYTLTPWLEDSFVETITAPPAGTTKTWEVILAPAETKLPTTNPFAATHPNAPLRQAVRIELTPEEAIYLENRQLPFNSAQFGTSQFDSDLPATGVFVSSAVDRDTNKLFRVFCVLETPGADPLDVVNEEWERYATATNRVRVRLVEVLGVAPPCYRVQVTCGDLPPATGTKLNLRIRDWTPPPWETPDIWVDTEVDNAWGVYTHTDAAANPDVAGHPVWSGDRLQEGQWARLYARVWNDGTQDKVGARVQFRVVKPAGMGPNAGVYVGEAPVDVAAGYWAVAGPVSWVPMNANDQHVCVRAFVIADPDETDFTDNMAQENFSDWYVPASSPYEVIELPFQVTNPLPRRALIQMRASGLEPGSNMTVEPYEFWLESGETRHGRMLLEAEDHVMLEDDRLAEGQPPPIVSLDAYVLRGCTFVRFGGMSGLVHTVRRTTLDMAIDPTGGGYDVVGTAKEPSGPVAGGQVTVRLTEADGMTVLAQERSRTAADGHFHVHLSGGRGASPRAQRYLLVDSWLSPLAGYAPATAGPVQVN